MNKYEQRQFKMRIINEVARYIMRFADYGTLDGFHIPLEKMNSLLSGCIPYDDKETSEVEDDIGLRVLDKG